MRDVKTALMRHCATECIKLPNDIHEKAVKLADQKYRTWEWSFGKSPAYAVKIRKRFSWGALDFHANIKSGCIDACCFYGDFFVNSDIKELESALIGTQFKADKIIECLQKNEAQILFIGAQENDLPDFFTENILS